MTSTLVQSHVLALTGLVTSDNRWIGLAVGQQGIYRSRDRGTTWTQVYDSGGDAITAVATAPDPASTVYAAASGVLLRSSDTGQNWEALSQPQPFPIVAQIVCSPHFETDQTLFVATLEDGVLRSTDGGRTWLSGVFGLYDSHVYSLTVHQQPGTDHYTLFAGTDSGIFRSDSSGLSWTALDLTDDIAPVLSLSIANLSNPTLLVGTERYGLWQLNLSDHQMTRLGNAILDDTIYQVIVTASSIWALGAGRLYISPDQGDHWSAHAGISADKDVAAIGAAPFEADGSIQHVLVACEGQFPIMLA